MTPQEKGLYHQIHPLKLATDISAEIISLYLFWRRKLVAGLIVGVVPPMIVSFLLMRFANLEPYKQSSVGRYISVAMTPSAIMMRVLGTIVPHLGAWYRIPVLLPTGLGSALAG
jgi:hypothetical protein